MFKVGDKIKALRNTCSHNIPIGEIREITRISGTALYYYHEGSPNWYIAEGDCELIQSTKNETMSINLKEKFVQAFLSEPEKTFRKAGVTNGDGLLTEDGKTIFLSFLLQTYGAEFKKTVIDPMIAEDEKK